MYTLFCGAWCAYLLLRRTVNADKSTLERKLAEFLALFDEDEQLFPYREIALLFHEASRQQADGYYHPRLTQEANASLETMRDEGVDETRIARIQVLMEDILHRLGVVKAGLQHE